MRRVATILVLALSLLGCGSAAPTGEPVELLTGVHPDGCYAGGEWGTGGRLLVDPDYGTSFNGRPVMWREGYTGLRLAGSEVVVLNAHGAVIATTGREYYISIAPVVPEKQLLMKSINAYPAAAECPYAWDFIDCTAVAEGADDSEAAIRYCSHLLGR